MTATTAHFDALARALDLYDQAREAFADSPTEGKQVIVAAEFAWVDYRALRCGKPADDEPVAWARRRIKAYREMAGDGIHPAAAAVTAEVIGRIEEQFAAVRAARRA